MPPYLGLTLAAERQNLLLSVADSTTSVWSWVSG